MNQPQYRIKENVTKRRKPVVNAVCSRQEKLMTMQMMDRWDIPETAMRPENQKEKEKENQ